MPPAASDTSAVFAVAVVSKSNVGVKLSGKLAVSTDTRAKALPDVPTTTELGFKDSSYLFWTGVFVPVKTPRPIA